MLFEVRFYTTGWAIRIALLQFRWNKQDNYKGFSIEWVKSSYLSSGGLTWKEFRLAKRQQVEAAALARAAAEERQRDEERQRVTAETAA